MHLVHSPRHSHAAAESEGGGSDKEQHPRRVEGEYGQKRLGQNREDGREKKYDQRIAPYKEGKPFGSCRQIAVGYQQQADGKPGDGDSCQSTPIQIGGKTA